MVEVQIKCDIISFQLTQSLNRAASIIIAGDLIWTIKVNFFSKKNLLFMCVKFEEEQISVFHKVLIGISDLNR
jgi:hypothetical protein